MIWYLLYNLLSAVEVLLIIRIIMSWVNYTDRNKFTIFLDSLFNPILIPLRKVFFWASIGIDFSPIIVFIGIDLLKRMLL